MTLRVDFDEISNMVAIGQRATDDYRLTPEMRARATLRLRQLKAIQRYALKQQAPR